MPVLDLKPTSDETIETLGLSLHDLWIVKINDEVFGPFETESLKHYASANQDVFEEAQATQQDNNNWQPFFSYPMFQRRGPQVVGNHPPEEGPYWILDHGQKAGPFTKNELDKRIELGSIGLTELISTDEGHTWLKLYQVPGFDRRFHSSSELPFAPLESNFQKARLELIEKIEAKTNSIRASEELAHMAHSSEKQGIVLNFRAEDVPLRPVEHPPLSNNLKWQIPVAIAVMLTLVVGVRVVVTTSSPSSELAVNEKPNSPKQNNYVPNPSLHHPHMPQINRMPANHHAPPNFDPNRNQYNHESQYPTHIETHHNDYQDNPEPQHAEPTDEYREPAAASNQPEHSLVNQQEPTLDAVMNPQPVEEAADF